MSPIDELMRRVAQLEYAVAELRAHRPPPELSPNAHITVLNLVAHHLRIPPMRIRSHARHTPLVQARWLAWTLLRTRFGWTFPQIGKTFSVCHGSVMHGIASLPAERDRSRRLALLCAATERDLDQILHPEEVTP
jgi:chromosomal replication initiation ATPase DnaA